MMIHIGTVLAVSGLFIAGGLSAENPFAGNFSSENTQENVFNEIPVSWKWISDKEAVFSYDGTYTDSSAFSVNAADGRMTSGVSCPEKYEEFPLQPEGAVNLTYSPDSTMLAFTRDNDLYVADIASGKEYRLTSDGSDVILNGYASWVYYEEILGRPSKYRAFWWSPDSRKIGFYRFDNSSVPVFPIYSPFGQDGKLNETRYPKAGETNPVVKIGFVDVKASMTGSPSVVWADFDTSEDGYFGIPFWDGDGQRFFVSRMPRLQNSLELFAVDPATGSSTSVYRESYPTWIDWITETIFTEDGLYMVRNFETGWEQVYFLSYDGKEFRRLTEGTNRNISLEYADEKSGTVYFTAKRDTPVRAALYRTGKNDIVALTDTSYDVHSVSFSPDGKYFIARYSNSVTPDKIGIFTSRKGWKSGKVVADMAGEDFNPSDYALPEIIFMTTSDGFELPASIVYPKNFDPSGKYPVHIDIYGGPATPLVRDRWKTPDADNQWWSDNGIIQVTADCRAAGHNGRKGLDMIYGRLSVHEVRDFVEWADYLVSLGYVDGAKTGVEGFSFGGTMTTLLLFRASDRFHYGIAGGGVYDWRLYDSHYTERYMRTPQDNPEGYEESCVLNYAGEYPVSYSDSLSGVEPVMLKITHGTGDDNVHFQNTLQMVDVLQKQGKKFELMIYPDGMHGYRGYQGAHFKAANREFWKKYLLSE